MKQDEKIKILGEIGLSTNEAKTYLALLDLGKSPATEIAKKSKIYRSNVYEAIEKLIEKGLVETLEINNVKNYFASNPRNLYQLLKEKEKKLNEIIPELELSNQMSKETRETSVIEGINGFMSELYNLLVYNEEILIYGVSKEATNILKTKIIHFHNERINKKIKSKIIYNSGLKSESENLNKKEYSEAKQIPKELNSNITTIVCGGKVLIMNWDRNYSCIKMRNEGIAESYKKYFEVLWEKGK